MRTVRRIAILCAAILFVLTSCAFGKPKTEVRFTMLPGEIPSVTPSGFDSTAPAPLAPAGGFVYIQTGFGLDALVLGPYPVKPGKPLICTDIPAGTYPRIALFYSPEPVAFVPVIASDDRDFWNKVNMSEFATGIFHDGGAAVLFGDLQIKGLKVLQATFIPISRLLFDAADPVAPAAADTAGLLRKQFIRIQGGTFTSIYVMLSLFNDEGITYAGTLSLYDVGGVLVDTKALNRPITADLPASVLFNLQPGIPYFLYLEYRAKGNRKLDLSYF